MPDFEPRQDREAETSQPPRPRPRSSRSPAGTPLFLQSTTEAAATAGPVPFPAAEAAPRPVAPAEPVDIELDPYQPWLVIADRAPSLEAVSYELYGMDLQPLLERVEVFRFDFGNMRQSRIRAYPELMLPRYRSEFHRLMRRQLQEDVDEVESKLLETFIDADDEAFLIGRVEKWANRKDLRTESGRSYFDAFLHQLRQDRWYTDYGLWESDRQNYFDLLHEEVEERVGELTALIAQNSREFGGYRPLWAQLEERAQGAAPAPVNDELVGRTTDVILDRLVGYTSSDDSKAIADALTGLPPREQAAVIRRIMSRYDESDWTGLFGRFGEAWEGGMLYYLFEDLTEDDRTRVADSLKASGVLPADTVDAFAAGRGIVGELLPYTTRKGQEAAQFWAEVAVESEGPARYGAMFAGGLASLWTPETAGATILTLGTAGIAPGLGQAFPTLGKGMLVVGTGISSYELTLSVTELATGRDAYTGEALSDVDKTVRVLRGVSSLLMLGAGFAAAAQLRPPSTALARTTPPGAGGRGAGAPPPGEGIPMRVIEANPQTGDYVIAAQNPATGEIAIARINAHTGEGHVFSPSRGSQIVRGWQLQPQRPMLPPAEGVTAAPEAPVSPAAGQGGALARAVEVPATGRGASSPGRAPPAAAEPAIVGELDAWLRHGTPQGAPLPAPAPPDVVQGAIARLGARRPLPGDLGLIAGEAVADVRAYLTLSAGSLGPSACAGYCNLAAKGVVPTTILGLMENSPIPVQVDMHSANVLGKLVPRPADEPFAAHQFGIVRGGGESYIVDPTFAQFLQPGSSDVRQFRTILAPGFLDTAEGARFAHALIGQGYVPLTEANAALYSRALGLDLGPVGDVAPGPVARLLLSGEQHYSTLRFESEAGTIRFVDVTEGPTGAPLTEEQLQTRMNMIANVERPDDLIGMIERQLAAQPQPTTPEAQQAVARLRQRLATLRALLARHSQSGPWAPD